MNQSHIPKSVQAPAATTNGKQGKTLPAVPVLNNAQLSSQNAVTQLLIDPEFIQPGLKVKIKRTTDNKYHGAIAEIIEAAPGTNKFRVRLETGGTILIVNAAQMFPVTTTIAPRPATNATVDIAALTSKNQTQIEVETREAIQKLFEWRKDDKFVLGGSFAIMLYAFASGKSARTPRDIDIYVSDSAYFRLAGEPATGGPKFKQFSDKRVWGIPLELHNRVHGQQTPEEEDTGKLELDKLLAKDLHKLAEIKGMSAFVPKPDEYPKSQLLLDEMRIANNSVLRTDKISMTDKEIWIKTLMDIETMVASGANLSYFNTKGEEKKAKAKLPGQPDELEGFSLGGM